MNHTWRALGDPLVPGPPQRGTQRIAIPARPGWSLHRQPRPSALLPHATRVVLVATLVLVLLVAVVRGGPARGTGGPASEATAGGTRGWLLGLLAKIVERGDGHDG